MNSDREKYNVYMKNYMAKRYEDRMRMAKERLGGKCVACGSEDDLQFHHIIPEEKEFTIGSFWNMRLEKFLSEIDKCELRCETHHKKKHESPHGTYRKYRIHGCRCSECKQWWADYKVQHNEYRKNIRKQKRLGVV